jgi:hypothetical protein
MKKNLCRLLLALALSAAAVAPAAENFTLIDANGEAHSLAGYRGKWLIVNFWATGVRRALRKYRTWWR